MYASLGTTHTCSKKVGCIVYTITIYHVQYLISVHVDNLVDIEREQDVEEQDLVAPDDPLLLALPPQPLRPLVRHELHPEPATRAEAQTAHDIVFISIFT